MATLKDIADRVGVSHVTVSRVLNGEAAYRRPKYAARAEHIREVAKELGYRVNTAARATSTGRFHAVGLLAIRQQDTVLGAEPSVFMRGLVARLDEQSISLSYAVVSPDAVDETTLLREHRLDGLVLDSCQDLPEQMRRAITASGMPTVRLNELAEHDAVYPDDEAATAKATELALDAGHRRIALYGSVNAGHYSGPARADGYTSAMKRAGLRPRVIGMERAPLRERVQHLHRELVADDRPTALVVLEQAWQDAMLAACQAGLSVPEDLSLVGVGQLQHVIDAQLTLVRMPTFWVGRAAADMLVKKIAQPDRPQPAVAVPYRHVDRGTTLASCS